MMKKYAVTTTKFQGTITYGFADNGWLASVEIDGVHEPHAHKQVCTMLPFNDTMLLRWPKDNPSMTITEVVDDISFETFWKRYNYKVGKKEAEAAWNKLSNDKKTKALNRLPAYEKYLADKGIAKAYAQKYLNKERFEDEY
jgi:hypothetical protein